MWSPSIYHWPFVLHVELEGQTIVRVIDYANNRCKGKLLPQNNAAGGQDCTGILLPPRNKTASP